MLKLFFQLRRDYQKAKAEAIEKSVNVFESKANPLFVLLFFSLLAYGWIFAIFIAGGFEQLYNLYGLYPEILFFIISYFCFFLGSKLLVSPSEEEVSDDTSIFALFSACGRKSGRSLASIGLSLLHALIFMFYLINKDLQFM
jgi:hypothetical protein